MLMDTSCRLVFVNKLNRENANFVKTLEQLRQHFGTSVAPLQLPIGKESDFRGVVDLLKKKAIIYEDKTGLKFKEEEIPAELVEAAEEARETLMESVAESEDELLMKYLDGKTPY